MKGNHAAASGWAYLTNHAQVLICLARNPDAVLREVAAEVGVTERAAHKIISDLEQAAVLTRTREGRRNHYAIHRDQRLRHHVGAHCTVGELLALVEQ
ncbi:MAG: DNA-binding MarR family transcriptional regulator [Hyphomicrobiaceae bacterium]|jgi:DNA-binding MarR family transcriptional regulator